VRRHKIIVPWITTPVEIIAYALSLARVTEKDTVYDLGCGDGRVPIIAAKYLGAKGVCVEIDDNLCALAQANIYNNNVEDKVSVVCSDMFTTNLSKATVIYTYLYTSVNKRLSRKIESEIKEGSRIITIDMPIPHWVPFTLRRLYDKNGILRTIYLYIIGISNPSSWRITFEYDK